MTTATYERNKKLRIRKEPSTEAEIVGYMEHGDSKEVLDVADGWCKVDDGYIMESLVSLTDDTDEAAEQPTEEAETATEDEATEGDTAEAENAEGEDAEGEDTTAEATDDTDEAAELRKMTNPQLYELCVKSGIKVKKNASKDAMIAALTNPDA